MNFTPEQLHTIDLIGDHIAIFLIIIVLILLMHYRQDKCIYLKNLVRN